MNRLSKSGFERALKMRAQPLRRRSFILAADRVHDARMFFLDCGEVFRGRTAPPELSMKQREVRPLVKIAKTFVARGGHQRLVKAQISLVRCREISFPNE